MLGTLHLRNVSDRQLASVLDAFLGAGGRWIDTATLYGGFGLLRAIGRRLSTAGVDTRVWVKVGYFDRRESYRDDGVFRDTAARACEAIGPYARVVALHEGDWATWWRHDRDPGVLSDADDGPLVEQRIERFTAIAGELGTDLGVSGNHAAALRHVLKHAPSVAAVMVAKQYDLVWRNATALIEHSRKLDLVLGAPWHQGWLRDLDRLLIQRPHLEPAITRLRHLCRRTGKSVDEVALPFVLQAAPDAMVAVGARSAAEVEQAISTERLEPALLEELRALGLEEPPMGPLLQYDVAARLV